MDGSASLISMLLELFLASACEQPVISLRGGEVRPHLLHEARLVMKLGVVVGGL